MYLLKNYFLSFILFGATITKLAGYALQDAVVLNSENNDAVVLNYENNDAVVLNSENNDAVVLNSENNDAVVLNSENNDAEPTLYNEQVEQHPDNNKNKDGNRINVHLQFDLKSLLLNQTDKAIAKRSYEIYSDDDRTQINPIADSILASINRHLINSGNHYRRLDNTSLPSSGGAKKVLELRLVNGTFNNISTIYRLADAFASDINNDTFVLTVTIGLKYAYIVYEQYELKFFGWTVSRGYLTADILKNSMTLKIFVDLVECKGSLINSTLNELPTLKLNFSGSGSLSNWFLNKMAGFVLCYSKSKIMPDLERHVFAVTADYLRDIDMCDLVFTSKQRWR